MAPEALAGLGKLRECVAAARNLEHLIASRDVGPKILGQIVPDVAAELEPFSETVRDMYLFVQGELGLPQNALPHLVDDARHTSSELLRALRAEPRGPFNAKRRLSLERELHQSLAPLSSALVQMELLVEATAQEGVSMSVSELLSSAPELGSNRPHRSVIVAGDAEDALVSVPARIGLRCLGMIASALEASGRPCAQLEIEKGDAVRMIFAAPSGSARSQAEIPIFPHATSSLDSVRAALSRYGGSLLDDGSGLTLPAA